MESGGVAYVRVRERTIRQLGIIIAVGHTFKEADKMRVVNQWLYYTDNNYLFLKQFMYTR